MICNAIVFSKNVTCRNRLYKNLKFDPRRKVTKMARSEQPKKKKRPWKWALLGVAVAAVIIVGFFIYQSVGVVQGLDGLSKPKDQSMFAKFEEKPAEKPPE